MKWLFYEEENDIRAKVMLIYYENPPKELLDKGNYIEVENIPESEKIQGKTALPYCSPDTGEFWYEYVERPLTDEEKTQELEKQVQALNVAMAEMLGM